ncbi:hypothetical protein BKA00_001100 [Actinomadura coerulea]|uniref:Uncharacterized protein n=1 Tax=Actinomadura coerulea TaxID=46159 RepID=A0A7X0KXC5_9ACTN|nr:hypothetical protein [Actinomadura coerulea]MBB6394186.1 hypothetical protein [Actinomadura coerulea]GGQ20795.1 hypothetical protein GCM10010187_41550 [Actinomadura coerulea]
MLGLVRAFLYLFLRFAAIGFFLLVIAEVGFDVIWNAAVGIFPSWGGFIVFVVAVAALSGAVAKKRKKS